MTLVYLLASGCGSTTATGSGGAEIDDCAYRVDEDCFDTHEAACEEIGCAVDRCSVLESYPMQVRCEPQAAVTSSTSAASAEHTAAEVATVTEATLLGAWTADPECVSEMQGMEGADQATVEAVSAQIVQNHYVFTESEMKRSIGATEAPDEPYRVVEHEGATWTIEMTGPRGETQTNHIVIEGDQLRMSRDGALIVCMRRE